MKKLQRTIVLLTETPSQFQAEGFAADAALKHFDSVSFSYGVESNLPADLDERDQAHLLELKRFAGPNACFLIVYNKE